ncbi:MAG TPA: hypothetical protein VJC37_07620 [Planctomycetota bacterium]|nr:hypothetical protein [Planctomycetota bacterium]
MKRALYPVLFGAILVLNACGAGPQISPEDGLMQKRGFQKLEGQWTAAEEINGFVLNEKGVPMDFASQPAPVGLCMTVAINYQAAPEDINKIKAGFARFSELIWHNTWGNMYIKQSVLINNSGTGYITLAKLAPEQGGHAYFGGLITVGVNLLDIGGGKSDIGVRVFGAGLLHEFNHSMFQLPDEYPYKGKPDKPLKKCVMDPRNRLTTLCPDCENLILKRFTSFKFPGDPERADWGKSHLVPEIYFLVR